MGCSPVTAQFQGACEMPTYEYECDECGIVFDRFQHFSEEPLRDCPECGGALRRVIQPVGVIFKGKGFYVTDNRAKSSTLPKSEEKTQESSSASKTSSSDDSSTSSSGTGGGGSEK